MADQLTKQQCADLLHDLSAGGHKAAQGAANDAKASDLCECCNAALAQAIPWQSLFAKLIPILSIVMGAGTLAEKIAAVIALFSTTPTIT